MCDCDSCRVLLHAAVAAAEDLISSAEKRVLSVIEEHTGVTRDGHFTGRSLIGPDKKTEGGNRRYGVKVSGRLAGFWETIYYDRLPTEETLREHLREFPRVECLATGRVLTRPGEPKR